MNPRPPAPPAPTYDLLGVRMSVLNIPDAVRRIIEAAENGQRGYVCVTGVHGIMESRTDKTLKSILNSAFLCTPDGMPTVWMGKLAGHSQMSRVYGPDLMLAVMEATRDKPVRHFFYGGQEGVADDLKTKLEERFPGVQIVGTYCPPFRALTADELRGLQEKVTSSRADIIWVGLSTPKQERFMTEHLPKLDTSVMIGVGAAFDFHSGRVKQAPKWMQRNGIEWLYRLVQEPKRLWRRYLAIVPRFIVLVAADKTLGRSAFDALGGLLFRGLPWLVVGTAVSTLAGFALHPALWALVLGAGLSSSLALGISAVLAMSAAEEENPSVLPALPWLVGSAAALCSAVASWLGDPALLIAALYLAGAALAIWIAILLAATIAHALSNKGQKA